MSYVKGFTVKRPKKKKTKKQKTAASFMNPKSAYYKFKKTIPWTAKLKSKQKKSKLV
jgi:hypothetical protein